MRTYRISALDTLETKLRAFSAAEKGIFFGALLVLAVASFSLLSKVNDQFLIEVPAHGGSLREGIIGTPRFINPLLAVGEADRDLSSLVYSGLMKATPDGSFVPDLAERYSVSSDGLSYTFILKKDAVFHDGRPVTADDVEFTITRAQDSLLKSPKRLNWEGVIVEKSGEHEIRFILKQPYSPFISHTTIGILPRHIWSSLESDQFPFSQYNVMPIGSGPYRIESVARSKDGIPTSYTLTSFDRYTLGEPYIEKLILSFFPNEKAMLESLSQGTIESASNIASHSVRDIEIQGISTIHAPLTRVFGIFFNQNQKEILARSEVRKAFEASINRQSIIDAVYDGAATPASSPLPPTVAEKLSTLDITSTSTLSSALAGLNKAGWSRESATSSLVYSVKGKPKVPLAVSITTSNVPELVEAADVIASAWRDLGALVDVKVFEPSDLNQSVIRPRKYEALLFGLVVGRDPDLYAFWHSSQRNDPGLNIAMYTNARADKALEEMRKATSTDDARIAYDRLAKEIATDTPAIFLFSPDFIYAIPDKVRNVSLGQITTPNDRFLSIHDWYIDTEKIWRFLKETKR